MVVIIVLTEVLITLKFDWETVTRPFPLHVSIFWVVFIIALVGWTIWNFYISPYMIKLSKKKSKSVKSN
jgi:phosphatidylserine synthase 2